MCKLNILKENQRECSQLLSFPRTGLNEANTAIIADSHTARTPAPLITTARLVCNLTPARGEYQEHYMQRRYRECESENARLKCTCCANPIYARTSFFLGHPEPNTCWRPRKPSNAHTKNANPIIHQMHLYTRSRGVNVLMCARTRTLTPNTKHKKRASIYPRRAC